MFVKRTRWYSGKEKSGCDICVTLTEVHVINKICPSFEPHLKFFLFSGSTPTGGNGVFLWIAKHFSCNSFMALNDFLPWTICLDALSQLLESKLEKKWIGICETETSAIPNTVFLSHKQNKFHKINSMSMHGIEFNSIISFNTGKCIL